MFTETDNLTNYKLEREDYLKNIVTRIKMIVWGLDGVHDIKPRQKEIVSYYIKKFDVTEDELNEAIKKYLYVV